MTDLHATGGGKATASGMLFQQRLGAMVATWILADVCVDHRLGLGGAKPVWLRFETSAPVDDLLVATLDGGFIAFQAKTTLSLSANIDSPFGKTINQLVRHWQASRLGNGDLGWNRPLDTARDRLVVAVGPTAPASVRIDLPAALNAAVQPGAIIMTDKEKKAFVAFSSCVSQSWALMSREPCPTDLVAQIARLCAVVEFDPEGNDRAGLIATLGTILPNHNDASASWNLLVQIAGDLMTKRAGADFNALEAALATAGAKIRHVKDPTVATLERILKRFGVFLVIPSVLSVAASLQTIYSFTNVIADVLRNWDIFEQALWTAILQPLFNVFRIEIQSQLVSGLTIPVVWSIIGLRLYLFQSSPNQTVRQSIPATAPEPLALAIVVALVYLPACFYISLKLQGMFEGYLAPDPLMRIGDTLPSILLVLGSLALAFGIISRAFDAANRSLFLSWPSFLYAGYLLVLISFFIDREVSLNRGNYSVKFLGVHNFFEAPALHNVPAAVLLVLYALFGLPIYLVGRHTSRPVAIVTLGVLGVLALDGLFKAWSTALSAVR
ncbi:hypothetical protein NLM27_24970 [Bradyrhizobium sp. CCGB12]|uniref:hypothetical protein n=1 Tax=Bradyrhizobium sp. CCGB12 TaxID=2949632 RepID=UPI0020B4318D|nr:hypothetical protein [Bradyrhizobium sp. CCGB12]MCP3392047.1 hypothetical protein [Bradyrhizobium sp. CCGB12]